MNIYLLDASALVGYVTRKPNRHHKIVEHLVEQRTVFRQANLFVPNFCIVEVFNSLAKFHFDTSSERRLHFDEYEDCLDRFRKHIHWGQVFYPYDLNRYHILAADDIIPWEQQLPRKQKADKPARYDRLSSFDILLIAMGMELAFLFGKDNVVLITGDFRIKLVMDELKLVRKDARESARVPRAQFREPDPSRWPVPKVFDLWHDYPADLPCADNQKPLNLPYPQEAK